MRRTLKSDFLEALNYTSYRLFLSSGLLHFVSFSMQNVVRSWLMVQLTDSALLIAAVQAVTFAPLLVLSLFGGEIADRLNRKLVVLISDTLYVVTSLTLIVLTALNIVAPWHVLVLSGINGVMFALAASSRQTMTSMIVPRVLLGRATSTYAVVFNIGTVVGPAISAITLPLFGIVISMVVGLVIKVASIFVMLFIKLQPRVIDLLHKPHGVMGDIKDGIVVAFTDSKLRFLLLSLLVLSLTLNSYRAILPVFATDVLNVGAGGFSLLNFYVGLGAIIGAVAVSFFISRLNYRTHGVMFAIISSLFLVGFAFSTLFSVASIVIILVGGAISSFLILNVTEVAVAAPDYVRGRIVSLRTTFFGLTPIGSLVIGALADAWGTTPAMLVMAAACVVGFLLIVIADKCAPMFRRVLALRVSH